MMWRVVVAASLFWTGCGDDLDATASDLAAASDLRAPLDLARDFAIGDFTIGDLAACTLDGGAPGGPVDTSTFCAGTPIEGTCVQAFFAKVAQMFVPAGCCQCYTGNNIYCDWSTGAHYEWRGNDNGIFLEHGSDAAYGGIFDPARPDYTWNLDEGGVHIAYLDITRGSGDVTCPDGTHANVGAGDLFDIGHFNCDAVNRLVYPDIGRTSCKYP